MIACKQFRQWIWFDIYNELQSDQQKLLTEHLKTCVDCQLDHQEAEQLVELLNQKVQLEPTEHELETDRAELHQQLLLIKQSQLNKKRWKKLWRIVTIDFTPQYRFATAVIMLVMGMIVGRFFLAPGSSIFKNQQPQLTNITGSNFANVEFLKYNPNTKEVSIKLNTINENFISGDLEKPEIQHILAQTLISDTRPNVRLKTVGALSLIKTFDKQVLEALIKVLHKDDNPGVRLKAARLINTIPIDSHIKSLLINVFVKVLLNEENPAIRIEAVNGLSRLSDSGTTSLLLNATREDTSEYVKYKATQLLKRTKIQRTNGDL